MLANYFLLVLLWIVYFIVHSGLAVQGVKKYFERHMGHAFRHYRLIYNLIAVIGLLGIVFYIAVISSHVLLPLGWLPIVKFVGLVFATWSVLVLRLAFKEYSLREFLGIAHVEDENISDERLSTGGILRYIRHPIYSGTLLLVWGFWLFSPTLANLISVICISIYVWIGMRLEEVKLTANFGDAYRQYKSKVPALIPSLQSLRKIF